MQKKRIILCGCFLLIFQINNVFSQDFQAFGIRLGAGSGFVYKSYLNYENAVELIAYNKEKGLLLTALYFYNEPISMIYSDRFFLHYGFGAHAGYYREKQKYKIIDNNGNEVIKERIVPYPNFGFDAIAGIEYRLENYPVIVSFDIKPAINVFGPYKKLGNGLFDVGLSVLYKF